MPIALASFASDLAVEDPTLVSFPINESVLWHSGLRWITYLEESAIPSSWHLIQTVGQRVEEATVGVVLALCAHLMILVRYVNLIVLGHC